MASKKKTKKTPQAKRKSRGSPRRLPIAVTTPLHHPARLVVPPADRLTPAVQTEWGQLYQGDCLDFLRSLPDGIADMVFADPPFNLGKAYGRGISDEMRADDYLRWSKAWLSECVRVLAPGGSFFVFNLPRWLIEYGAFLNHSGMEFRHWIAMRMPKAFPRGKRLSPAHYGCLYYSKGGEPKTFNKIYVPIQTCRHCQGEIRDYGGHRKALNEKGINLMDVVDAPDEVWVEAPTALPHGRAWAEADELWDDIPPVRHSKYKSRSANELAPIMLERLIALATEPGELVIDPFGGAGTTFVAAERLHRRWLGSELGDVEPARERLSDVAKGTDARWERARGHGTRKRAAHQLPLLNPLP